MPLELRWVDAAADGEAMDQVALARLRAYAPASADLPAMRDRLRGDPRAAAGDWLLAELDGEPVGTATSLAMATWVRGGHAWCQGVAYVGTSRTHRRSGSVGGTAGEGPAGGGPAEGGERQPGVATRLMRAVLDRARERGQSVSALMPFRNSFYERFGYGAVERRHEWTVPTALLPTGDTGGFRHYAPETDLDALAACRQRLVCQGQLDIKRTRAAWGALLARHAAGGWFYVDRLEPDGLIRGYLGFETIVRPDGRWHLKVTELGYADVAGLRRALHLIAGQRDQYATASLLLPADVPLNRLLKETQLPHRVVPHAAAECRPHTRMMVRVLDHAAFVGAATKLPPGHRGSAVVAVHEPEGTTSTFAIDLAGDGRAEVGRTGQSPQFQCTATVWAAVACGDVAASHAARLGLADCQDASAAAALDALAVGPPPFCTEAF